ncbi:unnamed protein product [Ilex paraguariensis]|uniref:Uncharacterized protein n=1 Tax=Ilex paraguariensis TaxID=185542 RepID=A0ABC8R6K3_9AQUA
MPTRLLTMPLGVWVTPMAQKLLLIWVGTGVSQATGYRVWLLGGAKRMLGSHGFGMGDPYVAFIDSSDTNSGGANSLGGKLSRMGSSLEDIEELGRPSRLLGDANMLWAGANRLLGKCMLAIGQCFAGARLGASWVMPCRGRCQAGHWLLELVLCVGLE